MNIKNLLVFFIIIFSITTLSVPQVKSSTDFEVTINFPTSTFYQGDSSTITVSLKYVNTYIYDCGIKAIKIHFSWQPINSYYTVYLAVSPLAMPRGELFEFLPVDFNIPSTAEVGSNSYTVRIEYQLYTWLGWWSYVQEYSSTLDIHDVNEKIFYNLQPTVYDSLTTTQYKNFQGPNAIAILQQATNEYNLATQQSDQGLWSSAVSNLNSCLTHINQATLAESDYQAQQQQNLMIYIIIAVVVVVIILLTIVAIRMSRRKR